MNLPRMDLPPPEPCLKTKVVGRMHIVPVAIEGYEDGFNRYIEDIYKPMAIVKGRKAHDASDFFWVFEKRVRVYVKPLHIDIDGTEYHCSTCQPHWHEFPNGKPDEILLRGCCFDPNPTPPPILPPPRPSPRRSCGAVFPRDTNT